MKYAPLILLLCGCSLQPSYDDPDRLTRSWFGQPWPGYEVPYYTVREQVDTRKICGSPLGCSTYADGRCLILLSPIATDDTLDHERAHCILRHNGKDSALADRLVPVGF